MALFFKAFKSFLILIAAISVTALTTGCASGGFKITRKFARLINSQHIIIRIILYILTAPVFGITLAIDAIIFNTIDFWEGKVSAGSHQFEEGDKVYLVQNEYVGEDKLRKSTIRIQEKSGKIFKTIVFHETDQKQIKVLVNGELKSVVKSIGDFPVAYMYKSDGQVSEKIKLWMGRQLLAKN